MVSPVLSSAGFPAPVPEASDARPFERESLLALPGPRWNQRASVEDTIRLSGRERIETAMRILWAIFGRSMHCRT